MPESTPLRDLCSGKTACITGASRGLGAGLAEVAREAGMRLVLASRSPPALPPGPEVLTAELDVRDPVALDALASSAMRRFQRIDLWVNNAGLLEPIGPLAEIDPEDFACLIEVNVTGAFLGSRAYARLARDQGGGILFNISSGAARKAYRGWSAYCASKAALDRMSECLALEEGERGLRVHSVAPGVIETGMQECIRRQDAEQFPDVERFRKLKADGALLTPRQAAENLLRLAFDPDHHQEAVCVDVRG